MKQILFCLAALLIFISASSQTKMLVKGEYLEEIKEPPPKKVEVLPDTLFLDGVSPAEATKAFSYPKRDFVIEYEAKNQIGYESWYLTSVKRTPKERIYLDNDTYRKEYFEEVNVIRRHQALTILVFAIILFFVIAMSYPILGPLKKNLEFFEELSVPARWMVPIGVAGFIFGLFGFNFTMGIIISFILFPITGIICSCIKEDEGYFNLAWLVGVVFVFFTWVFYEYAVSLIAMFFIVTSIFYILIVKTED